MHEHLEQFFHGFQSAWNNEGVDEVAVDCGGGTRLGNPLQEQSAQKYPRFGTVDELEYGVWGKHSTNGSRYVTRESTVHESPVLVARGSGGGAHVRIDPSCGLNERIQVSRMTKGDVADCDTIGKLEQRMRECARKLWEDGTKRTGSDDFRFEFVKAILPLDLQRNLHVFEIRLPRHKNSMNPRWFCRVLFES